MRIQVNVADDLVKRIDEIAKSMGVSRSALCSIWLSQALASFEKELDSAVQK